MRRASPLSVEGKRYALLVGCTEYPRLARAFPNRYEEEIQLRGPVHDVQLLRRALIDVLSVAEEDITVLAGWPEDPRARPTKSNITRRLEALVRDVKSGDQVILYLAGHGTRQRTAKRNDPDEPDGFDEVFLPADIGPAAGADGRIPGALKDDLIGSYVHRIRDGGASVWVIIDACHAGTMMRGESGFSVRGLDPSLFGIAPRDRSRPRGGFRERSGLAHGGMDRIAAMYGAQSYGPALELDVPRGAPDATRHGLFTYLLVQELVRTRGATSYGELGERVLAAYQAFPCRIAVPLCEGDLSRRVATGEAMTSPPLLLKRSADGSLRLNAGRLGGVEPGVVADVLFTVPGGGEPVGRVEVVTARLHDAECRLIGGSLPEGESAWSARIAEWVLGDYRLTLAVVGEKGEARDPASLPEEVRRLLLRACDRFPMTDDPSRADWRIGVYADGSMWLEPAGLARPGARTRVSAGQVLERLAEILAVENLERIAASTLTDSLGEDLDVWVECKRAGSPTPARVEAGDVIHPGDQIRILMQKCMSGIYDVSVLFLDADYGVHVLYPKFGESARLEETARARVTVGEWTNVADNSLGFEHLLILAFPRGPQDEVINLSWLAQRGIDRSAWEAAVDPFEELLHDIATGRGLRGERRIPTSEGRVRARLITLRTEWPALAPPPWPEAPFDLPDARRAAPVVIDARPPDAWDLRGRFAFGRTQASRTRYDLLVAGQETPRRVLIDLDGGVEKPADPYRLIRERGFDAEAAFAFLEEAWIAWYDTDDSGDFDLVLIDRDRDAWADGRWERTDGRWAFRAGLSSPWLSQKYLRFIDDARAIKHATACFRSLVVPSEPTRTARHPSR